MKSKSQTLADPVLKQFANLWTLQQQPAAAKEWSLKEKFKRVKAAGFDGIGGAPMPEAVSLCQKHDLEYICYIDCDATNYQERLAAAETTKPARVNVQLCGHDTPPKEAAAVWIQIASLAEKLGLRADLEIHRDTCTETPEKAYEIAEVFEKETGEKIRFCFDFSHIAVVKHLSAPYAKRLLVRPDLIQFSRQVHFRPFNGHHCQVPATDGAGRETPEFVDYLKFLVGFISTWLSGAAGGEVLYACPEFGPLGGYGVAVFPNVWEDAIHLRAKTESLWKKNIRTWKKRPH